jgi:thiol-disulfide isomerase/thioredoxin
MKKQLLIILAVALLASPLVAAVPTTQTPEKLNAQTAPTRPATTFTHTVFIEEGTTTWCPNCPEAAEALYALYQNNSQFPFYYMALVLDMNKVAVTRFSFHYGGQAIPTLFFDGGNSTRVGATGNQQQTQQLYQSLIDGCGIRTVTPLNLTTTVVGHDDAKYDITVTIKNLGSARYIGWLRTSVTEIVSRWKDELNHPYHFAFLSYALQKLVILQPDQTKTYTTTWNGAVKHGNLTFPDLVDSNVMVISAVADIHPHQIAAEQYVKKHTAFYIDQTAAALVSKA